MSAEREFKVIGYFALAPGENIVCNDGACVIAGSEVAVRGFIEECDPGVARVCTIHKTRFGEIVAGLKHGAPYAFDEASFGRFYPLAIEIGLPVANPDFPAAKARGDRFLTLQLVRAESA